MFHLPCEYICVLKAGMSINTNMIPGASTVLVLHEEAVDRSEVFVDAEVKMAGAQRLEADIAVSKAMLKVKQELISEDEKLLKWIVNTLGWSVGAAEELEVVLKDT